MLCKAATDRYETADFYVNVVNGLFSQPSQDASPQHSHSVNPPNPSDQMKRGTTYNSRGESRGGRLPWRVAVRRDGSLERPRNSKPTESWDLFKHDVHHFVLDAASPAPTLGRKTAARIPSPSITTKFDSLSQLSAQDRLESGTATYDGQDRRNIQQTSSYWSVPEQNDFPALLRHFGTDWHGIAKFMTSKTHIMV